MNDWKLLGIEPTDDISAVKKAFAKKLKECRPEDDAELYQQVRKAYERIIKQLKNNKSFAEYKKNSEPEIKEQSITEVPESQSQSYDNQEESEDESEDEDYYDDYEDEDNDESYEERMDSDNREFRRARRDIESASKGSTVTSRRGINKAQIEKTQKELDFSSQRTAGRTKARINRSDFAEAQRNLESSQRKNGSRNRPGVNKSEFNRAQKELNSPEKNNNTQGRRITLEELKKIQVEMETKGTSSIDDLIPSLEPVEFSKEVLQYSVKQNPLFTFNVEN